MPEQKTTLSSYMTELLSEGRIVFSREEAQKALGIGRGAFLDAAQRQQRQNRLVRPRHGFYTIVPPEYISWGAPPPNYYIDSMMRHENCRYYVGLLNAAAFHGASHQAVMQFQVLADKRLPRIRIGRTAIVFYHRKNMDKVSSGIVQRRTPSGSMKISSAELTILDLLHYRRGGGGFDNIVTVISDLGEQVDPSKLVGLSSAFELSVLQRLGYLLDWLGFDKTAEPLHASISGNSVLPWTELEPWRGRLDPDLICEPIEKNQRWKIVVRKPPDPD